MKNLIPVLFLLLCLNSFSQEPVTENETIYRRDTAKNELTIGALNLVVFGALDLSYERILTPNSSWAVEAFILALDRNNEDLGDAYSKDYSLTGKYKYFFGDRSAWGFYVNGLAMISSGEYNNNVYYAYDEYGMPIYRNDVKNYTDFALGFGLGGKFVAKQGFVFDLSAGIGRNLFSSDSPTIVGQLNANLGYRF
ncbi:MAG TPA: hypothetical protein VFD29_01465 [Gillisia sp.]|nr:hypothetical protein [Gillisia sp.]